MAEDKYTGEDAREALKKILNLKKEDESSYAQEESSDGEIQENVTQTPEDILDTPIGVRDGILKSIDPNASNGFYYEIYFSGSNTSVYAKLTYGLGFDYTPEGEWKGDIYKVTEEVKVKLQAIKGTLQWIIVGIEEDPVIVPGASTITRGDSQIITHNDYTTIKNNDSVIKIDNEEINIEKDDIKLKINDEWVYINNKKICVEPCGTSEESDIPTVVTWIYFSRGLTVSCEKKVYNYDLDNEEIVSSFPLNKIFDIMPSEGAFQLSMLSAIKYPDTIIDLDIQSGTIGQRRYKDRIIKKIFPRAYEIYASDENNNIYKIDDWIGINTPPTVNNPGIGEIVEILTSTSFTIIIGEQEIAFYYPYILSYDAHQEIKKLIIGEEITGTAFIDIYESTYDEKNDYKLIITTENSIKVIRWTEYWTDSSDFVIEPYIETTIPIPNPKILRTSNSSMRGFAGNGDLLFLSGRTVYEFNMDNNLFTEQVTFDNDVEDVLYFSDFKLRWYQVSSYYGVRGNYIDMIKFEYNPITTEMDEERKTIEFPCPIVSYGIEWGEHAPI